MDLRLGRYWNHDSPFLHVFCTASGSANALKKAFYEHYGCKAGSVRKSVLKLSGHAAVAFLKFHGQPLGAYEGWVPKNDSRKYYRLPDAVLVEEAKKYSTRNEWRRKANGHYQHVFKHRRHLLEACTARMVRPGGPFSSGYDLYAYEFVDRAVYVGITCNPKRRHKDHQKRGPVASKIRAGIGLDLKILASGLMPTQAGQCEQRAIERYKYEGWLVLNRKDGGTTGQIKTKYSYAKLLESAKPFQTRKQFELGHRGAYHYACTHKLIDQLATDLGWPEHAGHVWTKEKCFQEAGNFAGLSEWTVASRSSYAAAYRQGWLTEIKAKLFTKKLPWRFWTKERCYEKAKLFFCRSAWQSKCKDGSYVAARRQGWLAEIAQAVFGPRRNRWKYAGS